MYWSIVAAIAICSLPILYFVIRKAIKYGTFLFMRHYFTAEACTFDQEERHELWDSVITTALPDQDECLTRTNFEHLRDPTVSCRTSKRQSPPLEDIHHLRVVQANIEMGRDFEAVLKQLEKLQPDILLLQEVDVCVPRTKYTDQVALIASLLDLHSTFVCEVKNPCAHERFGNNQRGGCQGNAILSRFPIEHVKAIRFPCIREPQQAREKHESYKHHNALAINVHVPSSSSNLTVVCCHLDPHYTKKEGRAQQLSFVMDQVNKWHETVACDAVVITGDMNTVSSSMIRSKESDYFASEVIPSLSVLAPTPSSLRHIFPLYSPTLVAALGLLRLKLDWMLVTSNISVHHHHIGNSRDQLCSDHYYLCADININSSC